MSLLQLTSPAKINLTLEILGKRPDNFHNLTSIIVSVNLTDQITIEESSSLEVICPNLGIENKFNLAYLAAKTLKEQYHISKGAKITIFKKIPISAGLGGGSSNAAMTLIGLNEFWGLNLKVAQLTPIASSLGSDITFFLSNGTAMIQGKGEIVRELPPANIKYAVIVSPDITIKNKTKHMFSQVNTDHYTKGLLTRKLEARIRGRGDIPSQLLFNVFDDISIHLLPELKVLRQTFTDIWNKEIYLCGAGPSLFTLVESKKTATALSLLLNKKTGFKTYVVEPTSPIDWD
ncbi:MAG: 4-diphosphocytidyl-2-C-methyl-D-erythritol kinase [Chloroflexi bacterium]|nr:MAG: 4-diphosphocytidyl-2-C-methyl-D-erythritol kinase [Chloroflexota bacterium]